MFPVYFSKKLIERIIHNKEKNKNKNKFKKKN